LRLDLADYAALDPPYGLGAQALRAPN